MHFVNCENPKVVHNQYTDTDMVVPCGYCDICISRKSATWVNRIEMERMSHPYSVFFTLTYSEDSVPKFVVGDDGSSLVNVLTGEVLSFRDLGFDKDYMQKSKDYVLKRGWICCPHVPYLQNFIKRVRDKVYRYENNVNKKRVRYYIATEYGPSTHRIHHHGILFFESDWLANHAKACIATCWRTDNRNKSSRSLGRTDVQFIEGNASSYVAKYLNCTAHLPAIYSTKEFRPSALFSRCPSIGSLLCNSEEIQKIFDSGSSKFNCYNRVKKEYNVCSLPASLENRLYPKVKYFSQISHSLRARLYRFLSEEKSSILSYADFKRCLICYFPEYEHREILFEIPDTSFISASNFMVRKLMDSDLREYFHKVFFDYDVKPDLLEYRRRRLYSALNWFEYQRYVFNLSCDDYLHRIEKYYADKDLERLNDQIQNEVDISVSDSLKNTMFVDTIFIDRIKERGYLTESESLILSSYGWDENEMEYEDFINSLDVDNFKDFKTLKSKSHCDCERNRKTKIKNEYISTHMSNPLIYALYGE